MAIFSNAPLSSSVNVKWRRKWFFQFHTLRPFIVSLIFTLSLVGGRINENFTNNNIINGNFNSSSSLFSLLFQKQQQQQQEQQHGYLLTSTVNPVNYQDSGGDSIIVRSTETTRHFLSKVSSVMLLNNQTNKNNVESTIIITTTTTPSSSTTTENSSSQEEKSLMSRQSRRAGGKPSKQRYRNRKKLTILGLFELTRGTQPRHSGHSEMFAAKLALADINEKNIVEGYELTMYTNDTKCDSGVGMDAFYHAIYAQKNVRMISLLGTACSEVTERLAKIVTYWNMVQVSFGSMSPSLSDRAEFPLFYRTVAPICTHDRAIVALIRHFHWDTVTFFTKNENRFTMPANHLVRELENANISCKATLTFSYAEVQTQLKAMKDLDSRIIIASFGSDIAPDIFCEVYHMGMFGSDYAWIWIGQPEMIWWDGEGSPNFKIPKQPPKHFISNSTRFLNVNSTRKLPSNQLPPPTSSPHPPTPRRCNYRQLTMAVENTLIIDRHNFIADNVKSFSGMSASDFRRKLQKKNFSEESPFAPETYDAVWSVALGLQAVRNKFNYTLDTVPYNDTTFSSRLMNVMQHLYFLGISGPVSFSGSDRVGITSIVQIQGGKGRSVGLFSPRDYLLNLNCSMCVEIRWHKNQVPIARREFHIKIIRVENSPYIFVAAVAFLGIVMAAAFLAFNLYHRKLKYIKLSSPRLNNMVIIGCIFAYVAVILLGSDFGPKHFAYICTVRAYLLSTGFSLAFGAMFAKTYRVHRIFTRSCLGVVKNKLLRDTQLMTLVMALLLIDCLIVSTWAVFDPMHRNLQNLTIEDDPYDRSVVYQPQIEVCRSQHGHVWLSILYGYKSLLLVVGVYMAWETRHVKIQALNDSNYIGLCVYVVVLTSVLGVSLANLVSEKVTLSFVSVTTLILISTTVTLCLLFLPKIHAIVKTPTGVDPVVESMGLKIEFNTRRFMVEDTKESLFRAEVQNRVYKRQIESIDVEIWRLENLFTASSSKTSLHPASKDGQGVSKKKLDNTNAPVVQVTMDPCSSQSSEEETESQSEIYTIYLHGPRFIIPISLFNFGTNCPMSTVAAAASEARAVATAIGISSSSNARSSWPNTRTLLSPSSNGLVTTKYFFKSEPRLLTEESQMANDPSQNKQQSHSADNFVHRVSRDQITWCSDLGEGADAAATTDDDFLGRKKVGSQNHCDFANKKYRHSDATSTSWSRGGGGGGNVVNVNGDIFLSPTSKRRKDSSTSTGGKQKPASFLLSVFKNPLSYLTGIITSGPSSTTSKTQSTTTSTTAAGGNGNKARFKRHLLLREASEEGQKLSSSVPDLWAVKNSPMLDIRKKASINSDSVVDTSVLYPLSDSMRSASVDPVLKLYETSDASPYL